MLSIAAPTIHELTEDMYVDIYMLNKFVIYLSQFKLPFNESLQVP